MFFFFFFFVTQIVKNLVFLAKILQILDSESQLRVEDGRDESVALAVGNSTEEGTSFTLKTLLNNMNKLATVEASQTPKHTQKVGKNRVIYLSSLVPAIFQIEGKKL